MSCVFGRIGRAVLCATIFGAIACSAALYAAPLQFTGVNLSGAEFGMTHLPGTFGSDYTYPTNSEVDYFTGKGMNTFRLPFRWERLQPTNSTALNTTELTRMTNFVTYATGKGANVIIDPHNFERYFPSTSNIQSSNQGLVGGTTANTQGVVVTNAMFADLWSRIATAFKGNDHVIFNLMNEPNSMQTTQLVTSENAAIVAIRAAGATNLILVPGNGYTGAWKWLPNQPDGITNNNYGTANSVAMVGPSGIVDSGNNFAFDMHQYMDSDGSGQSATINDSDPMTGQSRLIAATQWLQANHLKGFLGEFAVDNSIIDGSGATPENNPTLGNQVINNMLTYMQANSDAWLGWTWWGGGPWWPSNSLFLIDQLNGQDRPDMKVLSRPVFAHEITGDFDGNGVVDANDYAVWQNSFGQTGAGLAADANHNGLVDASDYIIWRAHANLGGAGALAGGSVPEPSALALSIFAALGLGTVVRRRR